MTMWTISIGAFIKFVLKCYFIKSISGHIWNNLKKQMQIEKCLKRNLNGGIKKLKILKLIRKKKSIFMIN